MTLVRENYIDFGPTFATEKLAEDHDLKVSRETLRKWMQDAGIWLSHEQRRTLHQPRLRRECLGELIQIDGSDHRWFEDRGPACTLLVFIDNATSTLMQLRFVTSESTFSYFEALICIWRCMVALLRSIQTNTRYSAWPVSPPSLGMV